MCVRGSVRVCVCACVRVCVTELFYLVYLCNDNLASDMLIFYRSAAEVYELAKPYIVIILGIYSPKHALWPGDCHILHVSLISSWFCKAHLSFCADSPTYSNLEHIYVKILLASIKIFPFHWMSNLHMHIFKYWRHSRHCFC